jgi:hypothetical protein
VESGLGRTTQPDTAVVTSAIMKMRALVAERL